MFQERKHGGNLKEASENYSIPEENLNDFSANINPLGPPSKVFEVIVNNLVKIAQYPDSRNIEVKNALSKHLKVDINTLILGNGASELIFLILNHLRPKNTWLPVPTFSEYEIAARAVGSNINHIPLQGDGLNFFFTDKLIDIQKGDVLFICNPNNPTGQLYDLALMKEVLDITNEKEAYLIIDESFLDFLKTNQEITFMHKVTKYPRLIILYSLTKFFAIPGLRLGSAVANPQLVTIFEKGKDPWNINIFAQLAGKVALEDTEYIEKTLNFFEKEKEYLYNQLKQIRGLLPLKPNANYILIELLSPLTATKVCTDLASQGILVRNCNSYPLLGEKYIRVAIKTRGDNLQLIRALKTL